MKAFDFFLSTSLVYYIHTLCFTFKGLFSKFFEGRGREKLLHKGFLIYDRPTVVVGTYRIAKRR